MNCIQIATCRRAHGICSTSVVNHSSTAILEPCHHIPWDMTCSGHIKKDHAHFLLAPLLDRLYRQDRCTTMICLLALFFAKLETSPTLILGFGAGVLGYIKSGRGQMSVLPFLHWGTNFRGQMSYIQNININI